MENRWLVLTICLLLLTSVMGMAVPGTALAVGEPVQPNLLLIPAAETKPNAPSNLVAKAMSSTQIALTWKDNSNNEAHFVVDRKGGASSIWAPVAMVKNNTIVDKNLQPNTTYYYRVCAVNDAGKSAYSNEVSITTPPKAGVPSAPSQLKATLVSANEVQLTWKDNSDNEDEFSSEIKGGNISSWALSYKAEKDATSLTRTLVGSNITYYFRVRARNAAGNSAYSNEVSVTTPQKDGPPAAPSNLTATVALSPTRVNLFWKDNSNNETSFYVERKRVASGSMDRLVKLAQDNTVFSDHEVAADASYSYRISARNSLGVTYSNEVLATIPPAAMPLPAAPSIMLARPISPTMITVTWKDNSNNEDSFEVYYDTSRGFSTAGMMSVAVNVTSANHLELKPNTQYYYKVRSHNKAGYSAWSSVVSATTTGPGTTTTTVPPSSNDTAPACSANFMPSPVVLKSPANSARISNLNPRLEWFALMKIEGTRYRLQVGTDPSFAFSKLIAVPTTQTTYFDLKTKLEWNKTYYWRVMSTHPCGDSPWSPVWSFKTN